MKSAGRFFKRLISITLSAFLLIEGLPASAFAEDRSEANLPEVEITEDILEGDFFYLGSNQASIPENGGMTYLVRVGRGGKADSESKSLIKIADLTARYGKDYTVSVRGSGEKVDDPEDNASLMDRISGSEFTQSVLADDEDAMAALETDEEGQEVLKEGIDSAVDLLSKESGLSEKYPGTSGEESEETLPDETMSEAGGSYDESTVLQETSADNVKESDGEETVPVGQGQISSSDPVQEARNRFNGTDSRSQRLETGAADADVYQDLQDIANVMTNAVVGASVELTFKEGEKEKFLEIRPKNNFDGDGDRMFYLILGSPTGTTTNSAASACAVTIVDDEESEPSVVSFSSASYVPEEGADQVTVTVERSGPLNKVASAIVRTGDSGSAIQGRDYSKVDRELFFPFGVGSLTVDIPIRTSYFQGEKTFSLELIPEGGCEAGLSGAEVVLTGTWSREEAEKESLSAEGLDSTDDNSPEDLPAVGDDAQVSTLSTVRTLESLKIDRPYASGHTDNHYKGNNRYETNNKRWAMDWESKKTGFLGSKKHYGSVGVTYKLSEDPTPYWLAGAQVKWDRTKKCAEMRAEVSGTEYSWYTNFGKKAGDNKHYIYDSTKSFDTQTVEMYPSALDSDDKSSAYPIYVHFSNRGNCTDCNWLWIYDIKPVLRPFQFNYRDPDRLKFRDEKGNIVEDDGSATKGSIAAGAAGQLVMFLGDAITLQQNAGTNVQKYAQITGMEISYKEKEKYKTLPGVKSTDGKSVTFQLTEDSIKRIVSDMGSGNFYGALKENKNITNRFGRSLPKYAELFVRPTFSKIFADVTLHNPYDFPVTVSISGMNYVLNPNETKKLDRRYYLGDKFYTSVQVGDDQKNNYSPVGVTVTYKADKSESEFRHGGFDFVDNKPVYISGTKDNRLNFQVLTIEPKLQKKDNQIIVRVRKSDVSKFDNTGGVLAGKGTENGDYIDYLYAGPDQTSFGKLYPVPAIPKDEKNTVCRWYDPNAGKNYEGNTLYFTAGNEPKKNILVLSLVDRRYDVKLSGTLRYMSYDLKTKDSGTVSALPAGGAVVSAGSGSAVADENGRFSTAAFPVHGTDSDKTPIYLRYMVSVNGKPVIKETALQNQQTSIDVSGAFQDGVSPVASDIFNGIVVEGQYNDKSAYRVEDGYYLPIDDGSFVGMTVKIKPADYNSSKVDENGKVVEAVKKETPQSVQLLLYGQDGKCKGKYDTVTKEERTYDELGNYYSFTRWIYFSQESEDDPSSSFAASPGDMLYLRLTTDRDDSDYTYSDLYTGYTFKAKSTYTPPIEQGVNSPVNINYDDLPFLSDTGMKLDFPFVTVGYTKTDRGYRMFIGASAVQIFDAIKGTHTATFVGDDGQYWKDLFSIKHPFDTFKGGMKEAYNSVFKDKENIKAAMDNGSLGNPAWRFDLMVGMFFDFELPKATVVGGGEVECPEYIFTGLGGFVSVTVGFKMAWYFIVPVVFIPIYIGIEIEGTVMGFLGAAASGEAKITMDDTKERQVDFDTALDKFTGSVNGNATIQINMGVGLCGTIGVRAIGDVNTIVNYAPSDVVSDYGIYVALEAGIKVDLFLTSFGKSWTLKDWKWGSFKEYMKMKDDPQQVVTSTGSSDTGSPFRFRAGSGQDSVWLGSETGDSLDPEGSAFSPSAEKSQVMVENSYERPDSKLITLSNNALFLAFIDSDNSKGQYQRTTLKLAAYKDGKWSTPVPVANDETGDFQPSICEMKDGRVMVAWVSSSLPKGGKEPTTTEYLNSMDVFAAIAEVKDNGTVSMVTEPEQITTDRYVPAGKTEAQSFYDCKPTVICDMASGDAMVYYIKSGRTDGSDVDLANPYTNDCVICYMPYSYEGVEVEGQTEHWLHDYFYEGEVAGADAEERKANEKYLIDNFGGQRFLDGPESPDGKVEYSIPDFTAIGYNSLAVYSYSVDFDSSMDTDTDRELYLQVYDFKKHQTKYRIQLTNDDVSDTRPQLFRTKTVSEEQPDDATDTKLYWYRDNSNVCYIDVSRLVREGVDANGKLLPIEDAESPEREPGDTEGRTLAEPTYVTMTADDSHASRQMADYVVTQDDKGSLYILWTEGAEGGEEIFGTSLLTSGVDADNEDVDNPSAAWSRPYQITRSGYHNDELAVALSGEDLMVVHNQFREELDLENETDPVRVTDMKLVATVLEPCGAVNVESLKMVYPSGGEDDDAMSVKLPAPGSRIDLLCEIANVGLTEAKGYKAELKSVDSSGHEETLSENIYTGSMIPNARDTVRFTGYTLPEHFDGMRFKVVTSELKEGSVYYDNHHEFETEPLEERGDYEFDGLVAYQLPDGFHLAGTVTNYGNAAALPDDTIGVTLSGPYNLQLKYESSKRRLLDIPLDSLAVGESMDFDVPVTVPDSMMTEYGYIEASVSVSREAVYIPDGEDGYKEINRVILGDCESVYFEKTGPIGLKVNHMLMSVNDDVPIEIRDSQGNVLDNGDFIFSTEDDSVARVINGMVEGVRDGTTTLRIIHTATGAAIISPVIVGDGLIDDLPDYVDLDDIPDGLWYELEDYGEYVYTGKKIKPGIKVYDGYKLLEKGRDYTISYANNLNAYALGEEDGGFDASKAPRVIIKGKGNYSDSENAFFKILPVSLEDPDVIIDDPALPFSGKDQKVRPSVKWNGKKLKLDKDYEVSVKNVKDKGESELTITGKGNFTGLRTVNLTVYDKSAKKPVSKLSVSKIPDQKYNGNLQTPALTVKDGSTTLSGNSLDSHDANADYYVSYEKNLDAGTGYAVITGNPDKNYVGSRHVSFRIRGAELKGAKVTGIESKGYDYTGSPVTLDELIKNGTIKITSKDGKALSPYDTSETGEYYSFTVSYENNVRPGKASMILKGRGGLTGTLKVPFRIAKTDVGKETLSAQLLIDTAAYAAGGSVPSVVVKNNGRSLRAGVDYVLVCSGNKTLGQSSVTVKGKGNYSGAKAPMNYTTVAADLGSLEVMADDVVYKDKAGNYFTKVSVIDSDGKKLKPGKDYDKTLVYTDEDGNPVKADAKIPSGTVLNVTVKALDGANYKGEAIGSFRVAGNPISKVKMKGKVPDQVYTGNPVTLSANVIPFEIPAVSGEKTNWEIEEDGYLKNINKGSATATVRGLGDYCGRRKIRFRISPRSMKWVKGGKE